MVWVRWSRTLAIEKNRKDGAPEYLFLFRELLRNSTARTIHATGFRSMDSDKLHEILNQVQVREPFIIGRVVDRPAANKSRLDYHITGEVFGANKTQLRNVIVSSNSE